MKTSGACFMRKLIVLFLLCACSLLLGRNLSVSSVKELYAALQGSDRDLVITLYPGTYDLTPATVTDSTLGNAVNPDSMITVTTGLHLVGKNIKLIGTDRRTTIIKTNAGYGIFIEHCPEVLIKDLTITGGTRDQDPNATSGAMVVKHSETEITGCIIENNWGNFSSTIAGICGVVGREGAVLSIRKNVIRNNSWDGVALYRKAQAGINSNLICEGRGAGIGITWDASASVATNVIHHYWKGIGTFGTASASVYSNLVRDIQGWGIIASGSSNMNCHNNEVRRIGNVGIALWDSTADMQIRNNVIFNCGILDHWVAPLVGLWINDSKISKYVVNNLFAENKEADAAYGLKELSPEEDSGFTFEHATQLFNNYTYSMQTFIKSDGPQSFDTPNYLKNSEIGINYMDDPVFNAWTWDPDKEPFED